MHKSVFSFLYNLLVSNNVYSIVCLPWILKNIIKFSLDIMIPWATVLTFLFNSPYLDLNRTTGF